MKNLNLIKLCKKTILGLKLLVKKFDGEFPDKYFSEIMNYIGMEEEKFHDLCDSFRSPHLWKKLKNKWILKHQVK